MCAGHPELSSPRGSAKRVCRRRVGEERSRPLLNRGLTRSTEGKHRKRHTVFPRGSAVRPRAKVHHGFLRNGCSRTRRRRAPPVRRLGHWDAWGTNLRHCPCATFRPARTQTDCPTLLQLRATCCGRASRSSTSTWEEAGPWSPPSRVVAGHAATIRTRAACHLDRDGRGCARRGGSAPQPAGAAARAGGAGSFPDPAVFVLTTRTPTEGPSRAGATPMCASCAGPGAGVLRTGSRRGSVVFVSPRCTFRALQRTCGAGLCAPHRRGDPHRAERSSRQPGQRAPRDRPAAQDAERLAKAAVGLTLHAAESTPARARWWRLTGAWTSSATWTRAGRAAPDRSQERAPGVHRQST
jgi:hypothetical protein